MNELLLSNLALNWHLNIICLMGMAIVAGSIAVVLTGRQQAGFVKMSLFSLYEITVTVRRYISAEVLSKQQKADNIYSIQSA